MRVNKVIKVLLIRLVVTLYIESAGASYDRGKRNGSEGFPKVFSSTLEAQVATKAYHISTNRVTLS